MSVGSPGMVELFKTNSELKDLNNIPRNSMRVSRAILLLKSLFSGGCLRGGGGEGEADQHNVIYALCGAKPTSTT